MIGKGWLGLVSKGNGSHGQEDTACPRPDVPIAEIGLPAAGVEVQNRGTAEDLRRLRLARKAQLPMMTLHGLERMVTDYLEAKRMLTRFCLCCGAGAVKMLRKHRWPVSLKDALRESARMLTANEQPKATLRRVR
jgi:hypothetical protein